jgi:two-component system chemotaxis sensor kinase CheA
MAAYGVDETRLLRAFLEEAEDLSQKLGDTLLALETDRGNAQLINEVFRLTHSLKSESALMGFANLSELAHRMEDVLGFARDGTLQLERQVMDGIFAGSDLIAEMMTAVGRGGSDADYDTGRVRAALSAAIEGVRPVHAAAGPVARPPSSEPRPARSVPLQLGMFEQGLLSEARDRGESLCEVSVDVDDAEPMKFARAYLVFSNLELVANVVAVDPFMEGELLDDSRYATTTLLLTTDRDEESLRGAASVDQITAVRVQWRDFAAYLAPGGNARDTAPGGNARDTAPGGNARDTAPGGHARDTAPGGVSPPPTGGNGKGQEQRVGPAVEGAAPGPAAELPAAVVEALPAPGGERMGALAGNAPGAPAVQAEGQGRGPGPVERASIRVDTRKLDDIWSLIAELVLSKSHIGRLSEDLSRGADMNSVREELAESFESLDKISNGMQQAMMDTRMIPISVIFSKFPRLVRDLSRKLGKPVELAISGEDTEIDRSIVEALADPLTHIIRNSLDHGIESPEERVRRGKSEKGRVSVAARRQGGNVVIELTDDGRGIDGGQLRAKAAAMGIAGAASFTEAQLLELVFLPGFSTKEVVTDLSGRGVGMDVVATRIRVDLKGDVLLSTEPGRSTRVTLVLPLTLTIVNALLVRGDSQLYAIPLTDVDSTAKLLATEVSGGEGRETSLWMGEELPVYSLGGLFGAGRRRTEEYFAVVLRQDDRGAFLMVDELIEEREVVIKPVDDLLNPQRLFSGVSVLEDGRLVFILDTSFIRREHFREEGP